MKNRMFKIVFGFYLPLVFASSFLSNTYAESLTEEENLILEPVVVTATRVEVPTKEAASSVTIIEGKTLEAKHHRSVLEALRVVPGLDIVQTGGAGGTTSAFLRGGNSNHTLVLIDGVQVNSPATGAYDFSDLTTDNIERIEIIRGPQSTLYGSDAVGGIIHIITKKGEGNSISSVSIEGGSFGSYRETLQISGATDRGDYSFSAGRSDTEGISKANKKNGNSEKDGYENSTFSSRIGFNLSHDTRLEWTARFSDAASEIDGCCPTADDPNALQNRHFLASSLSLSSPVTAWWDQKIQLSLQQDKLEGIDPDTPFGNFEIDTESQRLDWQNNLQVGTHNLVTVGYEYEAQEGKNKGSFEKRFYNNAFYAFNQFQLSPLVFNLGLRTDDNNGFGAETTYKAEAAYLLELTGSKIHAAYGTGFRAPTLNDLFFPGSGNPNLKPEESRSFEVGIEQALLSEKVQVTATYFHTRVDDLIIFVSDPLTFVGMPENIEEAKMKGWEIGLSVMPSEILSISANYTLTDAINRITGKRLNRRPKHKISGTITLKPAENLHFDLDVHYVGKRFNDTANAVKMGGYTLVNLSGSIHLSKGTQLFTRIENLFDKEYEEVSGFGTAGFGAYGGVKVAF